MRTHLDIFSGIGGFALAAQWNGLETIGFAEIDPYCSRILQKHWPGVVNYGDVRTVPAVQCDLITGGFPCQPFSVAGKRRGKADDRYLWPAMLAVIDRCRPAWLLGENVPGIANMVLDDLQSDLEEIGYQSQAFIVPACAVDAPHRRDRVWIVGHTERHGCDGNEAERNSRAVAGTTAQEEGREPEARRLAVLSCDSSADVADANKPGSQGRQCGELQERGTEWAAGKSGASAPHSHPIGLSKSKSEPSQERTTGTGFWTCASSGSRWLPEPDVGRVAHGVPARVDRLRGLGNAIVPQVAAEIIRCMIETEKLCQGGR